MVFAKAVPATEPRNKTVQKIAWIYAGLLVVLALAQLYAFEKFIPLIQAYGFAGGEGVAMLIAAVIVIAEVFALPFLLRMPLSPLARLASMVCGLLVPGMWLALGVLAILSGGLENAGILGAKVSVSALLQVLIAWALTALAMWAAWGLYPHSKK